MKHMEMTERGLSNQFYVLCGCETRLYFDSPEAASEAWKKVNKPLS